MTEDPGKPASDMQRKAAVHSISEMFFDQAWGLEERNVLLRLQEAAWNGGLDSEAAEYAVKRHGVPDDLCAEVVGRLNDMMEMGRVFRMLYGKASAGALDEEDADRSLKNAGVPDQDRARMIRYLGGIQEYSRLLSPLSSLFPFGGNTGRQP